VSSEFLGPKPTAKQMELLRKLCQEGAEIRWFSGIRGPDSARLIIGDNIGGREKLRTDTLTKFYEWGWVEAVGDPAWAWRNNEYRITATGRKVVELGVIRK
jgi:hypothetical protein